MTTMLSKSRTCLIFGGPLFIAVLTLASGPVFNDVEVNINAKEGAQSVLPLTTFSVTGDDSSNVTSCSVDSGTFNVTSDYLNSSLFELRLSDGAYLDYDVIPSYVINVTCEDDSNDTTSVTIQINVLQNNPPVLEIPTNSITVSEIETSPRLLLTLNVSDFENDTLSCAHLTSPMSDAFNLTLEEEVYNLYLTTHPGLDYDVISTYNVTLECSDAFGNSSVVLTVDVIKVSLPPVFENVTSIDVLEGATDVSTVATFNVTDPDGGDVMSCWLNASDFYVTSEQLNGAHFGIRVDSGTILDYDVMSSYEINVTCIDDENETASVSVQINVIKNHQPIIEIPAEVFTVLDTETSPRILLTLNVSDIENDTFSCVHLTSPTSVAFNLTLEGDAYNMYLTSDPGLDYDVISTYNVTLECWDAFGNSSVIVTVDVIDVTLPPVFENITTSIDLLEGVIHVSTLVAFNITDPDGGDITSCSLNGDYGNFDINRDATNGNVFDLRVNAGVILDYDVISSYEINVTCIDDDNETASMTFHINVIENQPPAIELAAGGFTVLETETSSRLLITLNVSDVENDAFYCVLKSTSPSSSAFVLNLHQDEYSLHITSNPGLDYDVTPAYNVTIDCWDAHGNSSVVVNVAVIDVTFPPVFEGVASVLDVMETTSSGLALETFNVNDPDDDGERSCTLSGDNGDFSVVKDVGNNSSFSLQVAPAATLDYDVISAYDLNITCFDVDNETSSTVIHINILPNLPPSIETPASSLTVLETETTQRLIVSLNVSDAENDSFTCTHVSTTPTSTAFGLQRHGLDYSLYLNANPGLDYDVITKYNVTVECWDSYNNSSIGIAIDVIDVTSPPAFHDVVSPVAVIESVANASPLTTVNVTDPDGGDVTSCHLSGNGGMFSLMRHTLNTELFDLFLSPGRSLDYDVISAYNVNVTCIDTDSETSSIVIRINVLQNTPPIIVPQSAAITVVENEQSSRLLKTLTVSDVEGDIINCTHVGTSPSSAAFTLILEGSDFSLYLTDNPGLDYDRTPSYDVTLECFDPYGSSNAIFVIDVTPTGPPEFTAIDSPLLLQDGTTGYVVLYVFDVADPDGGSVTCSHSGDAGTFKLMRYIGDTFHLALRADVTLNYDVIPKYEINITCFDGVGDNTTITSIVIVKPNEPPSISSPVMAVTVSENNVSQHLLYTLDVSDAENNTFACSLTSILPNTSAFGFWQDGTDYGLHLLNNPNLEYAVTSSYDVTVRCWDQKGYSTMTFVVYVIPNYPPVFTNLPAPDITLNANTTPIGTHVFTASATDVDSPVVTYSMTSLPEEPELFEIDRARGEIWTVVHLRVAVDNGYLLAITATDDKANTTEYRRVRLTNVNNVPVVQNLPNTIYINENTVFNTVLYTLNLDDPGDTVTVTFTVSPASYGNKFYMTYNTQLRQHYSLLNYEECNYFVVTFYASDGKTTSEPHNLTIHVLNVNEACDFTPDVYYVSLDEGNSFSNYVDPKLDVKDVDGDTLTFNIVQTPSAESTYFAINQSTGVITHALNYDVDNGVHPSVVTLKVVCVDAGGLTGTATVSVTVNDVNDNVPTFSMVSYVRTISQYDGPGTTIYNMQDQVTDRDSGDNAVVAFAARAVTTGSNSYFYWTPEGVGMLMVYADDVMTSGDVHRFILTAADRGQPPLASTTTVDIIFELENSTTSTTEVPLVSEASSVDFWEQTSNIMLVTLVCFLGLLLIGIAAFLTFRKLIGRPSIMRPLSPKFRKISPKPAPHPEPFEFWSVHENTIGGVIHKGLANPSV